MSKYRTSNGWAVDIRKLRTDDRLFVREIEDDNERAAFLDECVDTYRNAWGVDIVRVPA